MSKHTWTTRPIEQRDWETWCRLFKSYGDFYETPIDEDQLRLVWSWIHEDRSVEAIAVVAEGDTGDPVGIAHLRSWVRPLRGEIAGYLDDLFVDSDFRGSGAVDALFNAVTELGAERGWSIVRWTTADDNYRARTAYDRVAARTGWITYEMHIDVDHNDNR
jgi:ribosomal protein S18 acetylase RimI-like enzyme